MVRGMRLFSNRDSIGKVYKELYVGRIYFDRPKWRWRRVFFRDFGVGKKRLNPHISVVGESGSGKSNFCRLLIRQLAAKGAGIAVLDAHNEYLGIADAICAQVYDASYSGINIFDLDGMDEREKTNELTGMFKRIFRLGEVQGYVLYKCILYTYRVLLGRGRMPCMADLIYSMRVFKGRADSGERRVLEALERRLALLDTGMRSGKFVDMDMVMRGNSIFLLSGLHTAEAQAIYVEGFLRKVYTRMLGMQKGGVNRFYAVIDEAERLGQRSILGRIAAEGRKYGVGVIAIAQRAKSIDRDLRSNSSLFFSFYQREPEELNYIANMMSGGNEMGRFLEVKRAIRSLRVGSAVVLDSSHQEPVIVRFERDDSGNACLAYEIINRTRKGMERCALLRALGAFGFSEEQVLDRIDGMLADRTLQQYDVGAAGAYRGTWYIAMPRNSAEHDICVGIISSHLSSSGIRNIIHNGAYGPDVIAFAGRKRIAYEYETGSKSTADTMHMLEQRARSYPEIVVVVNDSQFLKYGGISVARVIKFSNFVAGEQ